MGDSFVIIPRMFYIPYKFAQSTCIPPKLKCESLAHKGSQTTCPTPGDYLASWNRKPIDFSGKEAHCRHVFFVISITKWSVKEDDTMMSKVPKGEGKNPRQKWKNCKLCWGAKQRIDIQLSKLRFEASVNFFVSRLVRRKGNLVFNIMYGKFWFDGDFFVQNLNWAPPVRVAFYFLDRLVLFLSSLGVFFFFFFFFFFFHRRLSSDFDFFHEQKFFLKQKASTS